MRFAQQGFALLSFSVIAGALANSSAAYAGQGSDEADASSTGAYASDGSSGAANGTAPAADLDGDGQRAMFVLDVPVDAKVFFEDEPTSSTGTRRRYRTPVLKAGKTFAFSIRVEVQRNGRLVANTQEPQFQAGSRLAFAFDFTEPEGELVATKQDPTVTAPPTVRRITVSGST